MLSHLRNRQPSLGSAFLTVIPAGGDPGEAPKAFCVRPLDVRVRACEEIAKSKLRQVRPCEGNAKAARIWCLSVLRVDAGRGPRSRTASRVLSISISSHAR